MRVVKMHISTGYKVGGYLLAKVWELEVVSTPGELEPKAEL